MDDHKFDDIIKGKVADYEAPGFDPGALSAFHHQMGTVTVWPWYSRYRTELLLSSGLVLCTLILLWNQWSFNARETQALKKNDEVLKTQQQQIDILKHEIEKLKNLPPDTIKILEIKDQSSQLNSFYLQRIKTLEYTLQKITEENLTYIQMANQRTAAAMGSQLSSYRRSTAHERFYEDQFTTQLVSSEKKKENVHGIPNMVTPNAVTSRQLSTKTIRDLEKHYRNGIGIRVGPALEVSRGFYDVGNTRADLLFGVLADFVVSPSLSVETGAKYTHRFYEITNRDVLSRLQLPGVDTGLGPLANADVDSWMAEFPINVKYRYPLSIKTNLLAGVGYSSLMYTKQVFEYYYELTSDPTAQINTTHKIEKFTLTPGMLNFSIGLSKEIKNNKILETSLYYQYGLGEFGVEEVRANFLGIRGTYWFKIR